MEEGGGEGVNKITNDWHWDEKKERKERGRGVKQG